MLVHMALGHRTRLGLLWHWLWTNRGVDFCFAHIYIDISTDISTARIYIEISGSTIGGIETEACIFILT